MNILTINQVTWWWLWIQAWIRVVSNLCYISPLYLEEIKLTCFISKGLKPPTSIAYSDHYDAFDSLRQGMSDAVAALKTTDFLLAQLDNLSRSPEASGNPDTLTLTIWQLISPIISLHILSHSTRLSNLSQRSKGRVCPLRFQSPLCSLLEDCLGAACLHTQLVSGRRGDGCLRWRRERKGCLRHDGWRKKQQASREASSFPHRFLPNFPWSQSCHINQMRSAASSIGTS